MGTTQIAKSPAIPPPIWKNPIVQQHEHILVGVVAGSLFGGLNPILNEPALHMFHDRFGDAGIGDAIVSSVTERYLVLHAQGSPIFDESVFVMGEQVEQIFF